MSVEFLRISQLNREIFLSQISTKMVPLFWKWSSVGQIRSQIKKLIFLEMGDGRWWVVQLGFSSPALELELH